MSNIVYLEILIVSIVVLGILGIFFNKKNLIFFLIYLEIIYNGFLMWFLYTDFYLNDFATQIYFLFLLIIVAVESIIGLVLVILYQKMTVNVSLSSLVTLSG